jgi:hypothetical protein
MPQDLDETMLGASNRACAALAATPDAAIGIGLESGIFRAGGHTFDVCCCCIRVRETQTDSFGFGSSWQMPAKVAERLDQDPSVTLNMAWEPLVSDADPTGQGLLGQLSGGVATRSTCECGPSPTWLGVVICIADARCIACLLLRAFVLMNWVAVADTQESVLMAAVATTPLYRKLAAK